MYAFSPEIAGTQAEHGRIARLTSRQLSARSHAYVGPVMPWRSEIVRPALSARWRRNRDCDLINSVA